MHPAEIAKELKQYSFFKNFNESLILQFAAMVSEESHGVGDVILREGSTNDRIFFLRSGAVEISLSNEVIAEVSDVGAVFGEMSVATKNPVSTTVRVKKDSEFFVVSSESLDFVHPKDKDQLEGLLYQVYCNILTERLNRTNEKARLFEVLNRELFEAQNSIGKNNTSSVLLVESDPKKQLTVRMALGGTGVNLEIADTEEEAKKLLTDHKYDVVVSEEPFIKSLEFASKLQNPPKLVLMMCQDLLHAVEVLDKNRFVKNVITRQTDERNVMIRYILTALSKIISQDIFGISKYLLWGAEVQADKITGSVQRHEIREKVQKHFKDKGIRSSVLDRINTAVEEMLMNAVYDAPIDSNGKPLFNHLSRKNEIQLDTHQQSTLSYASDGFIVAVSVSDPFGSLTSNIVIDYLKSCYSENAGTLNETKGGAGRGLHQIVEASDVTIFNVKKGVRTEVICIFYVDGKRRELNPTMQYFFS